VENQPWKIPRVNITVACGGDAQPQVTLPKAAEPLARNLSQPHLPQDAYSHEAHFALDHSPILSKSLPNFSILAQLIATPVCLHSSSE
jgi:hypothetical protein